MNPNQPVSPTNAPEQDKSKAAPAVQPQPSPAVATPTSAPTTKS